MAKLLTDGEIEVGLAMAKDWKQAGDEICREYKFRDFAEALGFVNAVGGAAEAANHHPDIDIRWNKVRLSLSTHSAGGLTGADFRLARVINSLVEERD